MQSGDLNTGGSQAHLQYDVIVVGSGPAGSMAAWSLAKQGVRVIILEREHPPRYKTCGGGVVYRAFRHLPFPLDATVHRRCHRAEFSLPEANLRFVTERHEPIISMTMRRDFDYALLSEACRAGAVLAAGCKAGNVQQKKDSVLLETDQGPVSARFLIAADGATGATARRAGWPETRRLVPALEYEISLDRISTDGIDLGCARFDYGAAPYGYGWVFPKRDNISVGVLSTRHAGINLHSFMDAYLGRLGIGTDADMEQHGYVLPMHPRTDGFAKQRILLAGDAAGFADPLTGEGITYALLSGEFAARAILDSRPDPQAVAANYHSLLRHRVLPELRWGSFLAGLLYDRSRLRVWLFRKHGQSFCEAMANIVMGDSSYRQLLGRPGNYLKFIARSF